MIKTSPIKNTLKLIVLMATTCIFFEASADEKAGFKLAPDFILKSLDGENIRLREQRGKVLLVNFWASWCGPCRQELPVLEDIYNVYKKDDFLVLALNVDAKLKARDEFLANNTYPFPVLDDSSGRVADIYDNQAMPSSYIIDRDGYIRHVHKSFKKGDEHEYSKVIEKLINE